jgi:predicted DNA-binding protein with PD1-like motif
LRAALEAALIEQKMSAGFVLQGVGSLSIAHLRYAGAMEAAEHLGNLEILTLGGSLSSNGAHLHMSVSDARGHVVGGHVASDCIVRTTVEILIALLPEYRFGREPDLHTGFNELVIGPSVNG